jgi:hypothetical protein
MLDQAAAAGIRLNIPHNLNVEPRHDLVAHAGQAFSSVNPC